MKNTLLHLLFLLTTTKMMMVLKTESGVKDGQKLRRKFYMLLLSSRSWFWEEAEKVLAALVSNHFLDWDICCWRNEFNYFKTLNSKTLLFLWLINFPFEISLKLTLTLTCCTSTFSILSYVNYLIGVNCKRRVILNDVLKYFFMIQYRKDCQFFASTLWPIYFGSSFPFRYGLILVSRNPHKKLPINER